MSSTGIHVGFVQSPSYLDRWEGVENLGRLPLVASPSGLSLGISRTWRSKPLHLVEFNLNLFSPSRLQLLPSIGRKPWQHCFFIHGLRFIVEWHPCIHDTWWWTEVNWFMTSPLCNLILSRRSKSIKGCGVYFPPAPNTGLSRLRRVFSSCILNLSTRMARSILSKIAEK